MKSVSWDFMVDWRKLRLLHELDRRGTITATAEAMYLTPSAVSQQLASLSRDVGVPLLERRGRTVVLTGQARLLLSHADSMRELAGRTRAALDAWAGGTVGQVRVGSLAAPPGGGGRRVGGRRGERRVRPHRHRDMRRRGVLA